MNRKWAASAVLILAAAIAGQMLFSDAASAATTVASPAPSVASYCQTPVDLTYPARGQAVVNRLSVGQHVTPRPAFDRVVITSNVSAGNYRVSYVPQVVQDGSGIPVSLRGNADMEVRIEGAVTHNSRGHTTLPVDRYIRNWPSLREVRLVGDFEGVVSFGIGVSSRTDFRVFTLGSPARLVIDLARPGQHPFDCRSGAVKAYFFNQPRFVRNTEPFYTPVMRRVATPAVASGALESLFNGPTSIEYSQGLRFVNSRAFGFSNLSIAGGIARVRLIGDCSSGGSTVTIAGEIMPTLKQFPSVRYVKIYDPSGHTESPNGRSDSIPACLEP